MRIVLTKSQKRTIKVILDNYTFSSTWFKEELLTYTEVSVENLHYDKQDYLEKTGFVKVYQGKYGNTWVHNICLEEYLEDTKNNPNIPNVEIIKKPLSKMKNLLKFDN